MPHVASADDRAIVSFNVQPEMAEVMVIEAMKFGAKRLTVRQRSGSPSQAPTTGHAALDAIFV